MRDGYSEAKPTPARSGSDRPSFGTIGQLDIDLQHRHVVTPFHPDIQLFRVKRDVPAHHGQDFRPQQFQQIAATALQDAAQLKMPNMLAPKAEAAQPAAKKRAAGAAAKKAPARKGSSTARRRSVL